jgi:hypothetical protein
MIIQYVSNKTTQEEIAAIREYYKSSGRKVIIIVSGHEDMMDNLKDFIKARET